MTATSLNRLVFLHTSQVHVPTFQSLVDEISTGVEVVHRVEASLLDRVRANGMSESLRCDVRKIVREEMSLNAQVVVCTCSSIGAVVEDMDHEEVGILMRIDRAMADFAVNSSDTITVMAALESTLDSTRELIETSAKRLGRTCDIRCKVVAGAWSLFEAGGIVGYHQRIADDIDRLRASDGCVVLAQASMAAAQRYVTRTCLVLSSPKLGVEAAVLRISRHS